MALDFKTHIYQAFAQIPRYSAWLVDADLEPTYGYERRVLKLLAVGQPGEPLAAEEPDPLAVPGRARPGHSLMRGSS